MWKGSLEVTNPQIKISCFPFSSSELFSIFLLFVLVSKPPNIQLTIIADKQIFTFERLEPVNFGHFCLKWLIYYQKCSVSQLIVPIQWIFFCWLHTSHVIWWKERRNLQRNCLFSVPHINMSAFVIYSSKSGFFGVWYFISGWRHKKNVYWSNCSVKTTTKK